MDMNHLGLYHQWDSIYAFQVPKMVNMWRFPKRTKTDSTQNHLKLDNFSIETRGFSDPSFLRHPNIGTGISMNLMLDKFV